MEEVESNLKARIINYESISPKKTWMKK